MQVNAIYDTPTWVRAYLTIWQGILSLTDRELDLLCLIGERQVLLMQKVLDPDLLGEMLLSTSSRTLMKQTLGMNSNHFQNTLTSLLGKGALLRTEEGHYRLSKKLIPQPTITFNFTVRD